MGKRTSWEISLEKCTQKSEASTFVVEKNFRENTRARNIYSGNCWSCRVCPFSVTTAFCGAQGVFQKPVVWEKVPSQGFRDSFGASFATRFFQIANLTWNREESCLILIYSAHLVWIAGVKLA